jgi:LmbE family N-acetylglucosaminyl deacetylase
MALREMEASGAGKILGIAGLEFWREPDGSFSAQKNLERFERKITEWDPMIIYAPHEFESHPDHKQAFKMVRDFSGEYQSRYKGDLLFYEVWTPIRDMDHIVDISEFIESKKAAILAHKSQCDALRFDEAILGLNRYRGEMHSWPGGDYAEVFTRLKTRT